MISATEAQKEQVMLFDELIRENVLVQDIHLQVESLVDGVEVKIGTESMTVRLKY